MKYDYLLFDADDTLLDFKKSEEISFKIVLEKNGISGDIKKYYHSYMQINDDLWDRHALGLISKDFLKVERFKKLLEENHLEGNAHQMGEDYLHTLPDQVFLLEGTLDLLENLHKKIPLIMVTNGIGVVQHKRLDNIGLKPFFDHIIVSEECGFTKPDKRIFQYTFDLLNIPHHSTNVLMVGDKLETDILGAQNMGIDSCWLNSNQVANTTSIVPTYEIKNIIELLKFL